MNGPGRGIGDGAGWPLTNVQVENRVGDVTPCHAMSWICGRLPQSCTLGLVRTRLVVKLTTLEPAPPLPTVVTLTTPGWVGWVLPCHWAQSLACPPHPMLRARDHSFLARLTAFSYASPCWSVTLACITCAPLIGLLIRDGLVRE